MISTLIVPGLDGSGPGHWQRIWAGADARAELVEQDDWSEPTLSDWLHRLEAHIAEAPGAVIVAHSLGCVLVAHLAGRPSAEHVSGAVLVAPADIVRLVRQRPDLADFVLPELKLLPFPTILVASRNDPFMDWRSAEVHARGWGSALVDLGHAGHINVASGYGAWPDAAVLADGLRASGAANPEWQTPSAEAVRLPDAATSLSPPPASRDNRRQSVATLARRFTNEKSRRTAPAL